MGQAFDHEGHVLGEATGETAREVLDALQLQHAQAAEFRIRLAEVQEHTDTERGDPAPGTVAKHALNNLCAVVHKANERWWTDLETGAPLSRNVGEMLALVHSEISEALEGHRKSLPDDKLPHRSMLEVELADAVIRIFDLAAGLGLDLGGAFVDKMTYNATRVDHTREGRLAPRGKRY